MKKTFIIILGIMFFFNSCQKEIKKVVEEKYPSGKPKIERHYKEIDDKKEVIKEISYWESGHKQIEGSYKNTLREGHWKAWFENGNSWSEGFYINGVEDGMKKVWHENGQVMYMGQFRMGDKIGIWKFYDETGKLSKEINYDTDTTNVAK